MPRENLHKWKLGDELKAEWLDQMRMAAEAAGRKQGKGHYSSGWSASQDTEYSRIRWVRMTQPIGVQSSSGFVNQPGSIVVLNTVTGDWEEVDNRTETSSAFYDLPFDDEQLIPCHVHAGKLVPLFVQTVRHAKTCEDSYGYPLEAACPNVYPIKYVRLTYAESYGAQIPVEEFLDESSDADDYVLNLYQGQDNYLPVGTLIEIYSVTQQWFTFAWWTEPACEVSSSSESSISQSFSSSSDSSSSASSNSSSSTSSSNSSSSTSSSNSSSESSQSVSSSLSSSSLSSSSISGQSSLSSSGSQESSQSTSGGSEGCDKSFPEDITMIDGYDGTQIQVLAQSGGCLMWLGTRACV